MIEKLYLITILFERFLSKSLITLSNPMSNKIAKVNKIS